MITLSKIAKLANVSVSTASKAFSGSNDINEETRNLIFSVAKKHGVFKKFYKAKFPQLTVAVVVPEFSGDHYSAMLIEIQKRLEIRGCLMSVSAFDFSADNSSKIYDYYSKYTNVDGIIMIDAPTPLLDYLEIPTAVLGKIIETQYTSSIYVDLQVSLTEALVYFKEHNVTSVGFISDSKAKAKRSAFSASSSSVFPCRSLRRCSSKALDEASPRSCFPAFKAAEFSFRFAVFCRILSRCAESNLHSRSRILSRR